MANDILVTRRESSRPPPPGRSQSPPLSSTPSPSPSLPSSLISRVASAIAGYWQGPTPPVEASTPNISFQEIARSTPTPSPTFTPPLDHALVVFDPPASPVYGTTLAGANLRDYDDDIVEVEAYDKSTFFDDANDTYIDTIERYYQNVPPPPPTILDYSFTDINRYPPGDFFGDDFLQEIDRRRVEASKPKGVTPLTDGELAKVNSAWKGRGTVIDQFNITITSEDLRTLCDGQWLNDNVIDFYSNLVMNQYSNVWVWTTHFYTTLASKGYSGVMRWGKRKKLDLFTKDRVIVPINISNTHWAVAVVDNQSKTITYYDSLTRGGSRHVCSTLQEYMDGEAGRVNKSRIEYQLVPNGGSPQQKNGYDCGVFTCTNSRFLAAGQDLNFSQQDMKVIRRRMAYEILTAKLVK